jgi:hypothetical protein
MISTRDESPDRFSGAIAERNAALDEQRRLSTVYDAAHGTSSEMSTYHRLRDVGGRVSKADARVRELEFDR